MKNREYLNTIVTIIVDRPVHSNHPRHGFIYPVNYGYVPNTTSGDGEALDAYILGIHEPVKTFTGRCIAIIHRTNDDDDKLIVVPPGISLTDQEIREATHFQEQWFKSEILRENFPQEEL
jgi:inorganic pyrophosphatase